MKPSPEAITAYLAALRTASNDLPPDIADELIADVRSHLGEVAATDPSDASIRQAIDDLGSPEQIVAAARIELVASGTAPIEPARLPGTPTPVTAHPISAPPRAPSGQSAPRDAITVFLVLLGPLLALVVVRPLTAVTETVVMTVFVLVLALAIALAGTVLLWTATIWTTNEKLLGTLVWPGGLLAPLALGLLPGQVCETIAENGQEAVTTCTGFSLPMPFGLLLLVMLVGAPIAVAVMLLKRAGRRRSSASDEGARPTPPT
jgi:uncharacterized membrane protein